MDKILNILPGEGFGSLLFGSSMTQAEHFFGKPEEVALFDDIDEYKSTIWHYWESGFSLFFDEKIPKRFCCVEIDNLESEMWGKKIFYLKEKQIIELLKSKGIKTHEVEKQEWGEKRITIDEINIDFYFENNNLVSINYGKISAVEPLLILSN